MALMQTQTRYMRLNMKARRPLSHDDLLLLPVQDALTVALPADGLPAAGHNPFPSDQVYIKGFDDTAEVSPQHGRG